MSLCLERLRRAWRDRAGAAAVEFAMVASAFIILILGGFYAAIMFFVASSMQFAVEAGARCASVNSTVCSSGASTVSYVQSRYLASAAATPTFASSTAACGHNVTGSVTYVLSTGFGRVSVPLTASACFP
jgi:Flp pilus assembly protein TadG